MAFSRQNWPVGWFMLWALNSLAPSVLNALINVSHSTVACVDCFCVSAALWACSVVKNNICFHHSVARRPMVSCKTSCLHFRSEKEELLLEGRALCCISDEIQIESHHKHGGAEFCRFLEMLIDDSHPPASMREIDVCNVVKTQLPSGLLWQSTDTEGKWCLVSSDWWCFFFLSFCFSFLSLRPCHHSKSRSCSHLCSLIPFTHFCVDDMKIPADNSLRRRSRSRPGHAVISHSRCLGADMATAPCQGRWGEIEKKRFSRQPRLLDSCWSHGV